MEFLDFIILEVIQILSDTYIFRIKPKEGFPITPFSPGQYIQIKNPAYEKPEESHKFSLASSPNNQNYLELCIKSYGKWTQKFITLKQGDFIKVAGPLGDFIWDDTTDKSAVFLVGGIGIAPIMSMLRFINEGNYNGNYILLYGNRTPETVVYKDEILKMETGIKIFKIVTIFSEIPENSQMKAYRGFITDNIIKKEVDFNLKPIFFVVGPQAFMDKMKTVLHTLAIPDNQIKTEQI